MAHCFFYGFTGLKVPNNPFIFQSTLLFLYTPLLTRQILTGIKMPSKTPKEWQTHWYRKQTIGTFLGRIMFVLSCELNEQVQTCADKIGLFKSGRVACTGNKPANCDEGKKKNQHRLIRLIKTYFYLYAQVISEVWNSDPLFGKSTKRSRFLKIICVGFPRFIMCISRRKTATKIMAFFIDWQWSIVTIFYCIDNTCSCKSKLLP